MTTRNRDILFTLKMRNEARAALRAFGADLRRVALQASRMTKDFALLQGQVKSSTTSIIILRRSVDSLGASRGPALLAAQLRAIRNPALGSLGAVNSGVLSLRASFAGLGVAIVALDALSVFRGFESQMATVRAITGATESQFKALSAAARLMGSTTQFTAREAGQGLEYLSRAGFNAAQAIQALPAALDLATAAGIGLGDSADILTNIMSSFGLGANRANAAADVLALVTSRTNTNMTELGYAMSYVGGTARGLGVGLNETAAALGALADFGTKGTMGGTAVRALLLDLTALATGTAPRKAQALIEGLQIDKDKLDPRKVGLLGAMETLKNAAVDAGDAAVLFGARGVTPYLNLIKNLDKAKRLMEETRNATGTVTLQAAIMRDTLDGAFKTFRSAVEDGYISMIAAISDTLKATLAFGTEVIRILGGAKASADGLSQAAGAVAMALSLAVKMAVAFVAVRLSFFFLGVASSIGAATLAMVQFGRYMGATSLTMAVFRGALAYARIAVVGLNIALAANPIGAIVLALTVVIGLLWQFRDASVSVMGYQISIGSTVEYLWERMVKYAGLLGDAFAFLGTAARMGFAKIIEWLTGMFDTFVAYFQGITGISDETWADMKTGAKAFLNALISYVVATARLIAVPFKTLGQIATKFWDYAKGGFRGDFDVGAMFVASMDQNMGDIGADMGKDYVAGFVGAVTSATEAVAGAASIVGGAVSGAANTVLNDVMAIETAKSLDPFGGPGPDVGGAGPQNTSTDFILTPEERAALLRAQTDEERRLAAARTEGTTAVRQMVSAVAALQGTYTPGIAAAREMAASQKVLTDALKLTDAALVKMGTSRENILEIQRLLNEAYAQENDIVGQALKSMAKDIEMSGLTARARAQEVEVQNALNKAKERGLELDAEALKTLRDAAGKKYDSDNGGGSAFTGYADDLKSAIKTAFSGAMEDGKIDFKGFFTSIATDFADRALNDVMDSVFSALEGDGPGDGIVGYLVSAMKGDGGGTDSAGATGGGSGGIMGFLGGLFGGGDAAGAGGASAGSSGSGDAKAASGLAEMFAPMGESLTGAFDGFLGGLDGVMNADFLSGFGDTIGGFLSGAGDIFSGLFSSLGSMFGGGGGSSAISGLAQTALSILGSVAFANGGIMTSAGAVPLRQYSGGGVATSPQLAMFGEGSVPEAYVPVPSGRIPVEIKGGGQGGGTSVSVTMNISTPDANSFRMSQGQTTADLGREIQRQTDRNS